MQNTGYLSLKAHPEGGFYKEIYSSGELIASKDISSKIEGSRSLATSIYYLLEKNNVSHFHSLKSDEIWYYHYGAPLSVYEINKSGKLKTTIVGPDIEKGHVLQAIIPAGSIFGAALEYEKTYSLVGCMVSPGFDFKDFTIHSKIELLHKYPQHEDIIQKIASS